MDSGADFLTSIITPTFGRVDGLEKAIRSIDAQTETRWRHYIVIDGDPQTRKWLDHRKDKRVESGQRVIIYLEDGPHKDFGYAAINRGLAEAKEKYYCILADDNRWMDFHLGPLVEFLERHGDLYDAVYPNVILRHKNIPEFWKLRCSPRPAWNAIDLGDCLMKRELFDTYGPYEYSDKPEVGPVESVGNRYSSDWHFYAKALAGGAKITHLNTTPSIVWYLDDKNFDPAKWHHDKLVVSAFPAGNGGCAFYRLRNWLDKAREKGAIETMYYQESMNKHRLDFLMMNGDVLYFQGAGADATAVQMVELGKMGKLICADSDDDVFHIDWDNQRFMDMGGHEVSFEFNSKEAALDNLRTYRGIILNEGKPTADIDAEIAAVETSNKTAFNLVLFRDGVGGFDVERNADRLRQVQNCFKAADHVVTTSPVLAKELEYYNDSIRIWPNLIDLNLWRNDLKIERDEFLRVGWQGGSSHLLDLWVVRNPLIEVLKRNPKVKLVVAGFNPDSFGKAFPREQLEFYDWADFQSYPYRFHRMRIDVGIIPLRRTPFADAKSPIKWVEMGALEIPAVVSDSPVYAPDVEDGVNGMAFRNDREFSEKLQRLIDDAGLRTKLGKAARRRVEEKYDLDKRWIEQVEWMELAWLRKMTATLSEPSSANTLYPKMLAKWEERLGRKLTPKSILATSGDTRR